MSDSLRPCGLQHARLPCPSRFPRICSNSRPLSQWCHPTQSLLQGIFPTQGSYLGGTPTLLMGSPIMISEIKQNRKSYCAIIYLTVCVSMFLVAQSCLTLYNPMDCSLPGSSVRGSSPGKNTRVDCHALFPTQGSNQASCFAGIFFTIWAKRN